MQLTNTPTAKKILIWAFIVAQSILFVLSHLKLPFTTYVQYASIVLCFVFCARFAKNSVLNLIGCLALFFTVCADYVLAFLPSQKVLGMVFFCIVQICYFLYLFNQQTKKQQQTNLWVRIALVALCELVLWLVFKNIFNLLAALVIFYFSNLIFNTIFAFANFNKNTLLAIGFVLFILCDIFVGFGQMSLFFDVSQSAFFNFVYSIPFNIAWTFYIPSQVLIALGIATKK